MLEVNYSRTAPGLAEYLSGSNIAFAGLCPDGNGTKKGNHLILSKTGEDHFYSWDQVAADS